MEQAYEPIKPEPSEGNCYQVRPLREYPYHIKQEDFKMIDVVFRHQVAPGKGEQALEWASKLLAYVKKTGLSGTVFLLRPERGAGAAEQIRG